MAAVARPRFFPLIALVLATFTVVGFSRTYYLRFLSDLPAMTVLVHLHGLMFTAWIALFLAQTRLVAAHRVDLHMKLGIAGVVLAVLVFSVGVATVMANAAIPRIRPSGLTPSQFTAVGMTSLLLFGTFVALGIAFRRRAASHKRYMVLAMIGALTPAASRVATLLGLREFSPFLVPLFPMLFLAWCLVYDWRHHRRVHPVFAIGSLVIVASWPLRLMMGRSEWYQPIGEWFARLGGGISPA
jgi:hypothetical protein